MSADFYTRLAVWSQIAASVLFSAVMVYLWVKFVAPAVVAARDRKNAELLESERRRDAAKEEVAVAERELAQTAQEVDAIAARAARDAAAIHERILTEAKAEGERLVRNAEGELDRGRIAARETLRAELVAKALEIARGGARSLGDDVSRRLVGEVVDSLERRNAS